MGTYDALFEETDDAPPVWLDKAANREAKAARGGKYGALFDDAPAAPARPVASTGADLAGQARALSQRLAAQPDSLDALYAGARRGASLGFGDEIEAAGLRARDWITGRDARTPADLVSGRKAPSYTDYRDAIRARDAKAAEASPIASTVGELGGGLLVSAAVPGLGAGARGATAAARGARAGLTYGAASGAGNSEADLTKGDVGGFARDVAKGAAINAVTGAVTGKLVGDAPARVDRRTLEAVARGEAGGTARQKLVDKALKAAGEDGEDLLGVLAETPQVRRALAVQAKSNPGGVAKMVTRQIDKLSAQTEPIYQGIEKSIGESELAPLAAKFDKLASDAARKGDVIAAEAFDKAKARLVSLYGREATVPGTLELDSLPISSLRKMATKLGDGLFAGAPTPATVQAKQQVYHAIVDHIADEGARAGADVSKLRALNRQMSTLIPVRDALADRAAKASTNRTTLGNLAVGTALIGGGAAAGGPMGALAGAGVDAARRAALPAARSMDYALARLVQAARNGSKPAQLAEMAIELGLSRQVADGIARGGLGTLMSANPDSESGAL